MMGLLSFILLAILVFTALAIERVLKDIRDQNKEIMSLLRGQEEGSVQKK